MPVKMSASAEQLKGFAPVPEGLYEVRFEGFKPKASKQGDSINLNPQFKILAGPNWKPSASGRGDMLFGRMNTKAPWIMQDFSHCFGFPMEKQADGSFSLPGDFDGDMSNIEALIYRGPLTGRTGKVFVVVGSYNGKPTNDIKYYVCSVPECNTKFPDVSHSTDLLKKSK